MSRQRLLQFYEEELAYLASAGAAFAKLHPERASLVGLDSAAHRDPDVERLVEAFAFLAGQVRAELTNELPELTGALLQLLWPHYLREMPASVAVEYQPDIDQLTGRVTIPARRGFVESIPVRSPDTGRDFPCTFVNCYDVDLYPLRVRKAEVERDYQSTRLVVRIQVGPNVDPMMQWRPLRLHLAGDPVAALEMRRWLLEKSLPDQIAARIVPPEGDSKRVRLGPLLGVGFLPDQALLEYPRQSFPGYRLVQEYFGARHKFLYVDLDGMSAVNPLPPGGELVLEFPFSDPPPDNLRFSAETVRLFCTPALNHFRGAAVPIRYDGKKSRYEILADQDQKAFSIYRVARVFGQVQGQSQPIEYQSFLSFRAKVQSGDPYYHVSVLPGPDGKPAWYLNLVAPKTVLPEQVISLELECSNGELPTALLPGDVRFRSAGVPDSVQVRSLSAPDAMTPPPIDSASEWRFLSALAGNYLTLEDKDALVGALKLHDWSKGNVNWRRLQGIRSLKGRPGTTFLDGVPLRGRDVTIDLDLAAFTNPGDGLLFAEVLSHYFALYADINSYVRLTCRLSSGVEKCFPPMNGQQLPI